MKKQINYDPFFICGRYFGRMAKRQCMAYQAFNADGCQRCDQGVRIVEELQLAKAAGVNIHHVSADLQ